MFSLLFIEIITYVSQVIPYFNVILRLIINVLPGTLKLITDEVKKLNEFM